MSGIPLAESSKSHEYDFLSIVKPLARGPLTLPIFQGVDKKFAIFRFSRYLLVYIVPRLYTTGSWVLTPIEPSVSMSL